MVNSWLKCFSTMLTRDNTYEKVAETIYANLTTFDWLRKFNSYEPNNIPDTATLNVTINCSCGNIEVSKDYGLFITYPLRPNETFQSVAHTMNLDTGLLQSYNPGVNFSQGSGLVYIPGKGKFWFCFVVVIIWSSSVSKSDFVHIFKLLSEFNFVKFGYQIILNANLDTESYHFHPGM